MPPFAFVFRNLTCGGRSAAVGFGGIGLWKGSRIECAKCILHGAAIDKGRIDMPIQMSRLMLYVHDVSLLKHFYQTHFGLALKEEIEREWVVLDAGGVEIALHRVGAAYRELPARGGSNAKLVFRLPTGLADLREQLLAAGVPMRPLKRFDGFAYLMCDGEDPEGNIFQLLQPD
jgi:predicted enzyme related to lactoylglutathione lyase